MEGYKIKGAARRNKKGFIVYVIIWVVLATFLVPAITFSYRAAVEVDLTRGLEELGKSIYNPMYSFSGIAEHGFWSYYFGTLLVSTLIYSVFFFIGFAKAAPKNRYTDIEHGSSDWSQKGEQYSVLSRTEGIILAQKNYLPVDKRGNVNVLVVGGSGSGKSTSYSIPNAYQMLGSYVFTDPKGELYDATAGYLKNNGYQIKVLNLVRPQYSDGYNPLRHISSEQDVDVIAETIVKGQKSENSSADPYWDDQAEQLLKALIFYLIATRPEEEQNLASCAELVRAANTNGGSNMLTQLMSQLPIDHPARRNYKNIEIAPEKTYSSILSSLQSKLGKFDSKEIAELTSTDTINFEEIGNKKTALYVISSDTHSAYDFLLTIFFSQMIQQLYDYADQNGGRLKTQTFFILDEFANIGQIPDFDKKISTSRSRNISFSVILQNLDQLEAVYEKSYETIMGNCDTHLFLGSNSYKTLEYFSKALGEKTIERDSISVNKDRQYFRTGINISDNVMARSLMTPDELRRMDVDDCIIFVKGVRPIKTKKFYYFKDQKMAGDLAAVSINHNDISEIERGEWRKFNPYNPYTDKVEKAEDLRVESLDDLFEIEEDEPKKEDTLLEQIVSEDNTTQDQIVEDIVDNQPTNTQQVEQPPDLQSASSLEDLVVEDLQPIEAEADDIDLEKELEAKFDELFGQLDNGPKQSGPSGPSI